jgi:hypothetical protein
MPPYYRLDGLTRVAKNFDGNPLLTASRSRTSSAYLATLKE